MIEQSYQKEVGPNRRKRSEHPRAQEFQPPYMVSFSVDRGLGSIGPETSSQEVYRRGWVGHKAHMDRMMEKVLAGTLDPEEREVFQRAFTKLRMAL